MEDMTIPVGKIVENNMSINEYLLLYNIANGFVISGLLDTSVDALSELETKGFIKISNNGVFLRDKASVFFAVNDDLFISWLRVYPTSVTKAHGGNRALSPASADTILGKKLRKKWDLIFKKNILKQELAIKVLKLEVLDKTKSGDLEYMVEAARWLNDGYHEKYAYLLDQEKSENKYNNEDYM
jgi:hypothetical protein